MTYTFSVPGKPVAKQRARKGPYGFYTPNRTRNYETEAAWWAKRGGITEPKEGPVALLVRAYFPASKLHPEGYPHLTKPDADNIQKIIADALNGVAYFDDGQVYLSQCTKRYAREPRVEVDVLYGSID